jgi:Potential Queuosine, Q, salvage protein family
MSDDEADPELLEPLRQHFQRSTLSPSVPETCVLEGAEYVYNNSVDVALDSRSTREAAALIYDQMQKKEYSTKNWSSHELHPKSKDESTVAFIFTLDLLNFSFWSDMDDDEERFAIEYKGKRWTGYWSLVAALQRALDEGQFYIAFFVFRSLCLNNLQKSPSPPRISGKTKMSVQKNF